MDYIIVSYVARDIVTVSSRHNLTPSGGRYNRTSCMDLRYNPGGKWRRLVVVTRHRRSVIDVPAPRGTKPAAQWTAEINRVLQSVGCQAHTQRSPVLLNIFKIGRRQRWYGVRATGVQGRRTRRLKRVVHSSHVDRKSSKSGLESASSATRVSGPLEGRLNCWREWRRRRLR